MHHVLDNYGTDPAITKLLNKTELWFVPVANPDGYDYTFTAGQPAVAQEPARQQRRRADHRRRRRRPQPQLLLQVGLRQRGLLARPVQRDLPRAGTELRAGDQGAGRAVPADRLRVLHQLPLGRRAAALRRRLAGEHAHAGRRDLQGDGRRRRPPRGAGLRPGHLRRALHHQRRDRRPLDGALRHAGLHPRDVHLSRPPRRPTPTTSGCRRTASAASSSPTTRN